MKHLKYTTDKKTGIKIAYQPSPNLGWVEILKDHLTDVYYYPSMPIPIFDKCSAMSLGGWHIADNQDVVSFLEKVEINIGLKHALAQVCLKEKKFIMPLFAARGQITCGTNRFFAFLANGIEAKDISIVLLSKSTPQFDGWEKITSTQHFVELFHLSDLDHEIGIYMDRDPPQVGNSLIRHSIYETPRPLKKSVPEISSFWKKFQSETGKQIHVTISCTERTKSLIKPCAWFDVSYVIKQPEEWQFSFGIILGSFKDASESPMTLHLYLFDIIEPVELIWLFVWATNDYGTFISENRKSVLLDIHNKSSFEIIGNWVK